MHKYKLIDIPHIVPVREYNDELSHMTEWLLQFPQVAAIYQVGSIGAPGISDIDMVVVCNDQQKLEIQPLSALTSSGKYLFIHNLYGCSKEQFRDADKFSFFGTYKQLSGEKLTNSESATGISPVLKQQVALEFLLKMYVNLVLQKEYKTLKVRSLLLHVKGLLFDLEFLGIQSGPVHDLIHQCMNIRQKWFEQDHQEREIISWFDEFFFALSQFLEQELSHRSFFVSSESSLRLAKNIRLKRSNRLSYTKFGFPVPFASLFFGNKIHKALNKLNTFKIESPFIQENIPSEVGGYFNFIETCRKYNRTFLPNFYTLSSSLHL